MVQALFILFPAIAATINADTTGTIGITANFDVDKLTPILLNGVQITDSDGNVFAGYEGYVKNISYADGTMTFFITHFSEYGL